MKQENAKAFVDLRLSQATSLAYQRYFRILHRLPPDSLFTSYHFPNVLSSFTPKVYLPSEERYRRQQRFD